MGRNDPWLWVCRQIRHRRSGIGRLRSKQGLSRGLTGIIGVLM